RRFVGERLAHPTQNSLKTLKTALSPTHGVVDHIAGHHLVQRVDSACLNQVELPSYDRFILFEPHVSFSQVVAYAASTPPPGERLRALNGRARMPRAWVREGSKS